MSVITTVAIAALSIAGSLNNNMVERNTSNFLDPLGYTEYNLTNNQNYYSYNDSVVSSITSDDISTGSNIHVLTHGMGGNADHWLVKADNGNYLKTDYSLPFVLSDSEDRIDDVGNTVEETDTFIYKFSHVVRDNIWATSLFKLELIEDIGQYAFDSCDYIEEDAINGQIILLYEGPMGGDYEYLTNQEAYERFANSLNTVLTEIKSRQGGYLPSVNLIGHSRGGIINLLYAYHYHQIVNNLISLGTPYIGSTYAELLVDLYKNVMGDVNYIGYDDLLNPEHVNEYICYIDEINPYINTYAIGFSMTPYFLFNSLSEYFDLYSYIYNFLCENFSLVLNEESCSVIATKIIEGIEYILQENNGTYNNSRNGDPFTQTFLEIIWNPIRNLLGTVSNLLDLVRDLFLVIKNDHKIDGDYHYFNTDICVDLYSQLGVIKNENLGENEPEYDITEAYIFDDRTTITFDSSLEYVLDDFHCANADLYWVPHNFETKNPIAIDRIIEYLNGNDGFHVHNYETFVSTTTHKIKCLCGISIHEEETHTYFYEQNDFSTHYKQCSFEPCSYFVLEEHNNEYTYLNLNYHSQACTECNCSSRSPHLINIYVFNNMNTHTSYCACGLVGETTNHTVSAFTGKCTYCGMAITIPQQPPILLLD